MANPAVKEAPVSEVPVSKAETPVAEPAMTTQQLLTLVASMQQQLLEVQKQAAVASAAQTDAILEMARPKEPLKTARQIAEEINEEQFKKQQKTQEQRTKANVKYAQDACEHLAGCSPLGETANVAGLTSIIWHRGDVGQTTGICTVCQRIFKENDPDFAQWRRKKSFNKDSAAGQRTVFNPLEARELSYLHDID